MALNIRNAATERLAAALAELTGETKTEAVRAALADRLDRLRAERSDRRLADDLDDLDDLGRHCAGLPVLDDRPADAILGYNENGAPV